MKVEMNTIAFIFLLLGVLVVGFLIGFVVVRAIFKKQLKENPPMNENMVRAMMKQMGRTPSEKQVRQIMASMEAEQDPKYKTKKK